jgi:hypothetical protein
VVAVVAAVAVVVVVVEGFVVQKVFAICELAVEGYDPMCS